MNWELIFILASWALGGFITWWFIWPLLNKIDRRDPTNGFSVACCHKCAEGKPHPGIEWLPLSASGYILCPECGNKRCPKATDHNLKCTGSNEPGQPGSVY